MKFSLSLLLMSAFLGLSSITHAQSSQVSVRVTQDIKQELPKDPKDRFTKTQKRVLKVTLTNSAHEEVSVKIKYSFFGHGVDAHDVSVVDQGDKDATLKAGETQEVDTPTSTTTYTEDHYPLGKGAKGKIMGTGNKVTGYGVQVMVGDKIVAETYDPPSLKDQMGKAPAAPKEAPKK